MGQRRSFFIPFIPLIPVSFFVKRLFNRDAGDEGDKRKRIRL
jgi:hypothetical protein